MNKKSIARPTLAMLITVGASLHADATHPQSQPCPTLDQALPASLEQLIETAAGSGISYGFVLEAESFYAESGGESESDLTLATAELALEGQLSTHVSFHLCLLWEEDDTEENNVDEAYLKLGGSEQMPAYLQAGKMYLPFGNFESAFISDPLTLELAEINKSAVQIGFDHGLFHISAAAFKGEISAGSAEPENAIQDGALALSVTPHETVSAGVYWLSDLMETDGLAEAGSALATVAGYRRVSGVGAFGTLRLGPATLHAELAGATDAIEVNGGSYRPLAVHLEASVQFAERWNAAVRHEISDDFYAVYNGAFEEKFAGEQIAGVISCQLTDSLCVTCEYLHARELDNGQDANIISAQLALSF